jgi:hypothetical protein
MNLLSYGKIFYKKYEQITNIHIKRFEDLNFL